MKATIRDFTEKYLQGFLKLKTEWSIEQTLFINNMHVGYNLMDLESKRVTFCAFKQKETEVFVGVAIAMDILKMCKQYKIPLIIAYDKKFYRVKSQNLQWEGISGMQFTNSGVVFQKINLSAVNAEIIGTMSVAEVVAGEN